MRIEELSADYSIELEKLLYFVDNGLIENDGAYSSDDLRRVGEMCRLCDMGFDADDIKNLLRCEDDGGKSEYVAILRRRRGDILDAVHQKQKMLDDIDYMIRRAERGNL